MSKFFAKFKGTDDSIVMFKTKEERDAWVNFEDDFSREINQTKQNATFERTAITRLTAEKIIGKRIDNIENYIPDDVLENAMWIYADKNSIQPIYKSEKENKTTMRKNNKITLKPTMNITERKITAGAIYQNAVKIGTKTLAWIPVELLNVQKYQRDRQRYASQIAENWDDDKCDVLKVSYDKDNGWFNILDGQHRAAAAKMRGIEYLVCEILTGMTESSEAAIFVDANENSKKLNPYDTYKANLFIVGADETELSRIDKRIAAITGKYGIEVRKSEACGVIKSVPHIRKIMKREGEDCLKFIFEVVQGSHWDKFSNGYCYVVVEALRKIYNNHIDNLDDTKTKLCGYFIKHSPREVESVGNNEYANLGRTARWDAVLSNIIA